MAIEVVYGGIRLGAFNPEDPTCQDVRELARLARERPVRVWCDHTSGVFVLSPSDFRRMSDAYLELLELHAERAPSTGAENAGPSTVDTGLHGHRPANPGGMGASH